MMRPEPSQQQGSAGPVELPIRASPAVRRIILTCVVAEVLFVLLDYHVNYGRATDIGALRRLTNIAREDSLSSWFATTQTLLVALTLWWTWLVVRRRTASRSRRAGWLALAVLFSLMAVDDGAQLHERAGATARILTTGAEDSAATGWPGKLFEIFPSYSWMIVALPVIGGLGAFGLGFLLRELPSARQRWIVLAAGGCFALAIAMDFLEGLEPQHPWNPYTGLEHAFDWGDWTLYRFRETTYDTLRHFSKSVEEFLEMLANTLLWLVSLRNLSDVAPDVRIRLE
jgi:hypothetical protein